MIKKVLHLADLHIRNYKMHDQYQEVFNLFIKQVIELRKIYTFDEMRIVIAGDLFHQKITISNEQFMLGHAFLKECAKQCPVVIIAGNHDLLENNKDRMDSISPIVQVLDDENVRYYKESKCYEDDNIVWCVYSVFESNVPPDIATGRATYGDKLYVGLFHAPVIGSMTDTSYELEHGVNVTYFDGCDIVMLGDIHKRQEFDNDGCLIVYPSSMIQQNFGESIGNHGYLLWDIETKSYEAKDLMSTHGFFKFQIESLDDLDNNKEILVNK